MNTKPYTYEGNLYFADANVGDRVYYSVDITNAMIDSAGTIDSVTWTLASGITSEDEYTTSTIAYCKINSPSIGTYKITITVDSSYNGKSATDVQVFWLKVI